MYTVSIVVGLFLTINNSVERAKALDYAKFGDIAQANEQYVQAEQAYRKAIEILRGQPGEEHALAIVWRNTGAVLTAEGRFDDALRALKEASKLTHQNKFTDAQLNAEVLNSLGVVYFHQGDMRKAETFFTQAAQVQAPFNKATDVALANLGNIYQKRGEYAKAEEAYKRSMQVTEDRLGDSHPNLSMTLGSLGLLYNATGRYKDAEPVFQRSIGILEKTVLSDGRLMLQALHGLAKTYIGEHDERRAEPLLARAAGIARHKTIRAADAPIVIEVMETYSKVLLDLQDSAEAERVQAEARRLRASISLTVQASSQKVD